MAPLKTYDSQLNNIVKNLTTFAKQDGWVPPEGLPAKAAWPYFADDVGAFSFVNADIPDGPVGLSRSGEGGRESSPEEG